ncbi:hypothetical protein DERF_000551 [Dermatophagoides farinae]|uniref:Uncharacterized protein n=1 Tax=Dermatophagoides farinae TaxID=6954 RepID=A0A922LAA6_DERFA|nr:hypothetical protein DERF_000551 [Dermatophagoides farinae]
MNVVLNASSLKRNSIHVLPTPESPIKAIPERPDLIDSIAVDPTSTINPYHESLELTRLHSTRTFFIDDDMDD